MGHAESQLLGRRGYCGGKLMYVNGEPSYEVLGGQYSMHLHRAVVITKPVKEEHSLTELRQWLLWEQPDWSIKATYREIGKADGQKQGPFRSMEVIYNQERTVCYGEKQLKENLLDLGTFGTGGVMYDLAKLWHRSFREQNCGRVLDYPMAWDEFGVPCMCDGERVYLYGSGYSLGTRSGIVRYFATEDKSKVTRCEYDGGMLYIEVYRRQPNGDYKKTYVRHPNFQEALKSKTYEKMAIWMDRAAHGYFW